MGTSLPSIVSSRCLLPLCIVPPANVVFPPIAENSTWRVSCKVQKRKVGRCYLGRLRKLYKFNFSESCNFRLGLIGIALLSYLLSISLTRHTSYFLLDADFLFFFFGLKPVSFPFLLFLLLTSVSSSYSSFSMSSSWSLSSAHTISSISSSSSAVYIGVL